MLFRSALSPATLRAAIGPAISAPHFEVGEEVAAAFVHADLASAIHRDLGPKPHIDLQAALITQLTRAGVSAIDAAPLCTVQNPADFYSHRRDHALTGRLAAVIKPR